jgi:hypothetical protein
MLYSFYVYMVMLQLGNQSNKYANFLLKLILSQWTTSFNSF